VIKSLLRRAQSLVVGRGRHILLEVLQLAVDLIHDEDRMKRGRGDIWDSSRPLNRRRPTVGEHVGRTRTVICARAASSAGCAGEVFCPAVSLEGCAFCRGKAIGATWAKGYRHEGRVWNRRGSCVMGTRRRWEGRTALDGSRGSALVETELSRKTFSGTRGRSVKGVKVSLAIKRWCLRGSGRERRLRCVIVTRGRWRGKVVCGFSLENEG